MKEQALVDYFNNKIDVKSFAADLNKSRESWGTTFSLDIEHLENTNPFFVERKHCLQLCNEAIDELFTFENINTIAFIVTYSDAFKIDTNDEVTNRFFEDWVENSFGYAWTVENLQKWKILVETGVDTFTEADFKIKSD